MTSDQLTTNARHLYFLLVLVFVISPWPMGSNRDWAWPVLVIISSLATVSLLIFERQLQLSKDGRIALLAFFCLGLWILAQLFGIPGIDSLKTIDSFSTKTDLLLTVGYGCIFFLLLHLVTTRSRLDRLLYVLIGLGLLQALIGTMQQLVFDMARTTGSFANPNHFAGYLEVTISLGIGLIIAMEGSREVSTHRWIELVTGPRGRLRIVLIIMVVGLVMSRSRMGNMGFLISLILTSGIALIIARKLSWKTIALLTSIIIIDVAIIGSYFGLERIGERLQQAPVDMVKRVELQSYNLQVVKDHTLTGTGAGTYEMVMPRYRDQHIARKPTHAENDYFEFVIELGLIGCIPLITLLGLGMYHQARLLKPGNPQHFRGLAFGCMMGTICLLIHATADVNLQIPANAMLLILLLALPIAMSSMNPEAVTDNSSSEK